MVREGLAGLYFTGPSLKVARLLMHTPEVKGRIVRVAGEEALFAHVNPDGTFTLDSRHPAGASQTVFAGSGCRSGFSEAACSGARHLCPPTAETADRECIVAASPIDSAGHGSKPSGRYLVGYFRATLPAPATAFLLELIARLQDMATVPIMDTRAYARWLTPEDATPGLKP